MTGPRSSAGSAGSGDKRLVRRVARERLRAIDDAARREAGPRLAASLLPWLLARRATSPVGERAPVALFASMAEEIDLRPLDEALRRAGVPRAFPVFQGPMLEGDVMRFVGVDDDVGIDALPCGPMSIPTPIWTAATEVPVARLAAVVVPGLAFDERGGRLGRGKGYYDRALVGVDRDRAVGVAFDVQIFPEPGVPMDAHDVRLAWLCTPVRGVFRALS